MPNDKQRLNFLEKMRVEIIWGNPEPRFVYRPGFFREAIDAAMQYEKKRS